MAIFGRSSRLSGPRLISSQRPCGPTIKLTLREDKVPANFRYEAGRSSVVSLHLLGLWSADTLPSLTLDSNLRKGQVRVPPKTDKSRSCKI